MLLTGIQFCVIFIALFITTYLLSALVDFDADGRGMTLHKTAASILFPFYRGTRFNSASVILQISNYIFGIMYVLSVILGETGDIVVEAVLLNIHIALTVIAIIVTQHRLSKKYKKS